MNRMSIMFQKLKCSANSVLKSFSELFDVNYVNAVLELVLIGKLRKC